MNLRELSQLLGLSQTTVSRALNGFPEVSEETRGRVKTAAELHGYRPSAAARRLATGQSGTLGVVFPAERNMLGDLLFTEFLGGVVEKASDLGYDVTLAMARGAQTEEAVYRRAVRRARVDAIILSSPLIADGRLALLRELGMPFILHGRTQSEQPYTHLDIDNEGAFHAAARLLVDMGHRRIAFLNGQRRYNFAKDREQGFRRALNAKTISSPASFLHDDLMTEERGLARAGPLLDLPAGERPTAFLCSSIAQALGVRHACQQRGLVIGKDISLVAHDDRLHDIRAEVFDPPLTATQSSIGDAGRRVSELCVSMLRAGANAAPVSEIWPVDLIVRQSTAPPTRP